MLTLEKSEIIAAAESQIESGPRGVACRFINLGGFGLKLYRDRHTAIKSYRIQKFFAKFGIAPKVGDYIGNMTMPVRSHRYSDEGDTWEEHKTTKFYGFITELAETMNSKTDKECDKARRGISCRITWVMKKVNQHPVYSLFAKQIKYALESDNHLGNIAILNGKVVKIDFSEVYKWDFAKQSSFSR